MHPDYTPPSTLITPTSKTLIECVFYDFTKKISAGNILTSISDHLT